MEVDSIVERRRQCAPSLIGAYIASSTDGQGVSVNVMMPFN